MIKTLHVIGSKRFGGAERFYLRLIKALHERGEPVIALVRRDGPVVPHVPPGIPLLHAPMRTVWDPLSRFQVSRRVREVAPAIVQTYMGRATRLTHVRGSGIVHVARLGGFYKLDGYRHADAWVGNSKAICGYLRDNGFPARRVYHIPNFIEPPAPAAREELVALREQLGIPGDALVTLGVGRLIAKKGFDDLLAAFAKLPPTAGGRPIDLVVVGDGSQRASLETQARALGIAGRVHWAGWQNQPGPYYALADVFVCPSRHEPLGNVILEAWSHGVPVLSTATHGALELIADGRDGILTPCEQPTLLAGALKRLLRDDTARRELGAAGRRRVEPPAALAQDRVVDRYLALYHRLKER
ncbi:glycosyl transferase [Sulfurifustis variabilis]|uniref:Glycosyl transferase n=1 Tax=Sulfurifustis variabilis TaxID=1675686 RepID=A0A1C7AFY1_9GAMM|nr:glycosyltransferase [Sulfurifustis variabilis]BAU50336.1 glycosyl transferase [Sulfurifustis variabilis]